MIFTRTILQLITNIFLDKASEVLQYGLLNHCLVTMVTQMVTITLLSIKYKRKNYSYKINQKTLFYFGILLLTVCLKYNLKIYAINNSIPLYHNYILKTCYFGLKPLLIGYNYSPMNNYLNLGHLLTVIPVCVYIEMLIPEVYLMIQNLGEFVINVFTLVYETPKLETFTIKTSIYLGLFLVVEALILMLALSDNRSKRYSIDKELRLVQIDLHTTNTVDLLFSSFSALSNLKYVYSNSSIYYMFKLVDFANLSMCITQLYLYVIELLYYTNSLK